VASLWGRWLAIATAFTSALAFNVFHIPPTGRLTIAEGKNWVALTTSRSRSARASWSLDAVVRVARQRGTIYVFMGVPSARRGLGRLTEPVAVRLVRALPDVEVRLVAERRASG